MSAAEVEEEAITNKMLVKVIKRVSSAVSACKIAVRVRWWVADAALQRVKAMFAACPMLFD